MRTVLLAACVAAVAVTAAAAAAPKKPPVAAAAKPAAPSAPGPADWRAPDPNDVLVIDTNKGRILVEMVPEAAPQHVARMRELAHENFFDGLRFFRVIEDFMDQTGDPQNNGQGGSSKPNVPAEFMFRRGPETPFVLAADQSVAEIGFVKSLPVMSQSMALGALTKDQKVNAWGLYCPGVAGMARDDNPDSGNSQFFLMRGPFPSLERKYTAWGRVISGQDVVRAIKVGEPVADPQDRMERVRLLADLAEKDRPKVRVIDPKGPWFKAEIERLRAAKGPALSACDINIPAEVQ
ncbi:peptidylprolyl isomerase [Phenylobacterium sp.]|uniref:peptidylprolyl isomerase n=1 Tax=Phenylobacterium sp. TaxID=1871053 RepID=UPI003567D8EA